MSRIDPRRTFPARALLAFACLPAGACAGRKLRLATPVARSPVPLAIMVSVENHSRQLKRLRPLAPGEANTAAARAAALAECRDALAAQLDAFARARGFAPAPDAPLRLAVRITTIGEIRGRYLLLGIGSGVAWGVGTGLATGNPALALGLGLYELVEETIFWIGGASLFSRWNAPVALDAEFFDDGFSERQRRRWRKRLVALNGRKSLRGLSREMARRRDIQLTASLDLAGETLWRDFLKVWPEPLTESAPPLAIPAQPPDDSPDSTPRSVP